MGLKKSVYADPKVLDLGTRLQDGTVAGDTVALGVLARLWDFAGQYAKKGDIGRFSNTMIAQKVGWHDDPEMLIQGLLDVGFMERNPDGVLVLHDWHVHAEEWVDQFLANNGETYWNGAPPRRKPRVKGKRVDSARVQRRANPCSNTGKPVSKCSKEKLSTTPPLPPSGGQEIGEGDSSGGVPRDEKGDEVHAVFAESEQLRGMSYEQDLRVRQDYGYAPGMPSDIPWKELAERAVDKAELWTEAIKNPALWWHKRVQEWVEAGKESEEEGEQRGVYVPLSEREKRSD